MYETTTAEVMAKGMNCLVENLGIIDAERFISNLLKEQSDYTEWRRKYFANINLETFLNDAAAYSKAHPFQEKK